MSIQFPACSVLAIVLTLGSTSLADSKSHRQAAEELLLAMDVETQLKTSIDQSLDALVKSAPQNAPFKDVMRKFFIKYTSWDSLKDDLITIYADTFTEPELVAIKAFYQTPAGKKMAEKMPEMMGKITTVSMKRVTDNQAELQKMIKEEAAKPR